MAAIGSACVPRSALKQRSFAKIVGSGPVVCCWFPRVQSRPEAAARTQPLHLKNRMLRSRMREMAELTWMPVSIFLDAVSEASAIVQSDIEVAGEGIASC